MAKITITIEDAPGDSVKVVFTPSCQAIASKEGTMAFSPADNYALAVAMFLADFSKQMNVRANGLILPH